MASSIPRSFIAFMALLLSFLSVGVAAAAGDNAVVQALAPRQSPATNVNTGANSVMCMNYAVVANLSTVGLNSTYRGAYLRSAPIGTMYAAAILDAQSPKLVAMKFDANLNAQCGNWSAIALQEAEANFTRGVVLEYPIQAAPGVGTEGLTTLFVVIAIVGIMGGSYIIV